MKIAEKLATKSRLGPSTRRQPALVELRGRDAADRREIARHQRQHAGGEEGDDARREGGEDADSCGRVGAQLGEDHDPSGYLGRHPAPRIDSAATQAERSTTPLFNAAGSGPPPACLAAARLRPERRRARRCAAAPWSRSRSARRCCSSWGRAPRARGRSRPARSSSASRDSTHPPRPGRPGRRRSPRSSGSRRRWACSPGRRRRCRWPRCCSWGRRPATALPSRCVSRSRASRWRSPWSSRRVSGFPPRTRSEALLFTALGGLLQAGFSLCVFAAGDRTEEGGAAGWSTRAALQALSGQPEPALHQRPPRAALRLRPRRRRRRLLAAGDARARLLDPAHHPLRAAAGRGGDLPPPDPARRRHRDRPRPRHRALRSGSTTTASRSPLL